MSNSCDIMENRVMDFNSEIIRIGNVIIGKNSLRFRNQLLKISNISRTWIFKFPNEAKLEYEDKMRRYENDKKQHERQQQLLKQQQQQMEIANSKKSRNFIIGGVVCIFISVLCYRDIVLAIILWTVAAGCFYTAKKKTIDSIEVDMKYDVMPPKKESYPETYGLGVETNSGYKFAIASTELDFLRKIESKIHNADIIQLNQNVSFNLNDNSMNIEKVSIDKVETDDFTINERGN